MRGGHSSINHTDGIGEGGTVHDLASGISDLIKVMYGESNGVPFTECIPKYVAILAGQFQPFMKPPEYLDGSDYEIRLTSLIGRCIEAHELSPGECIIIGSNGLILTGKRCDRHEDLVSQLVRVKGKERALNVVSNRIAHLEEYLFKTVKHRDSNSNDGTGNKYGPYNQTLINIKRVVDLLKSSIFYNFTENAKELLPITEIDKRMESPSKYDRYIKKPGQQSNTTPISPSKQDNGRIKLINILDVDTIKESNKRRVIDLESKITWLIESFEIEKRKMRVQQMDEMNFNMKQQQQRDIMMSNNTKSKGGIMKKKTSKQSSSCIVC